MNTEPLNLDALIKAVNARSTDPSSFNLTLTEAELVFSEIDGLRAKLKSQQQLAAALAAETARADQEEQDARELAMAFVRERIRADRLDRELAKGEQRIAEAPHEERCLVNYGGDCDCWKSAAPTTEQ